MINKVSSLRLACMATISTHYEMICYGCRHKSQMNHLLDLEEEEAGPSYLNYPGPFLEFPSSLLEDLLYVLYDKRSLPKQMLHQVILPQLEVGAELFVWVNIFLSCSSSRVTP